MIHVVFIFFLVFSTENLKALESEVVNCLSKVHHDRPTYVTPKYGELFKIYRFKDFDLLKIHHHFPELSKYFLITSKKDNKSPCKGFKQVQRDASWAVLAGPHLVFLDLLDELSRVRAVSEWKTIYQEKMTLNTSKISELGHPLRAERLLSANTSVVTVSLVQSARVELGAIIHSTNFSHMAIIPIMEFMESHPLARSEWLLVFGVLSGKLPQAKNVFSTIQKSFENQIADLQKSEDKMPALILGALQGDHWHAPSTRSVIVSILKKLNIDYVLESLMDERPNHGPVHLSKEQMILGTRNKKVDIWLPFTQESDLKALLANSFYQRMSWIDSDLVILNPVKKVDENGSNDYWQTALIRVDLLVKDFINIIQGKNDLYWFERVK